MSTARSIARCSSCHCYSRGCPEGLPNHKHSPAVGKDCTMNSQGRHFRDPEDPDNPSCDYESRGQKCDFFSSDQSDNQLPYPTDISLGPITQDTPSETNIELSQIVTLLQQQKADSDKKFDLLQNQVNALARSMATTSSPTVVTNSLSLSSTRLQPNTTSLLANPTPSLGPSTFPYQAPYPMPSSHPNAPSQLANAAGALNAQMSGTSGAGQTAYQPLNIQQLRADPGISLEAERLLQFHTQNVPSLNPSAGITGQPPGLNSNQVSNTVDQLYAATMRNKQLKAFEFAATGQFCYRNQLKQDNINAVLFAYGSFKHLEAVKLGLLNMNDTEFLARLRHLKNVFEIACLSSNISAYSDHSWQVAREYDIRVISDIESGVKTWSSLSNGLETDAIYCANQLIELRNKAKKGTKDPKESKDLKKSRDTKKLCTTFNTHRASEGCYWEHNNRGETCIFEHYCSWCKENRDVKEKHKALNCTHKPE